MRALDATVETVRPNGATRQIPIARVPPAAGRHAACGHDTRTRRVDHGGHTAETRGWNAPLSEGARSRLVRLRAGVGRCDRAARRQRSRRARRRGAQAVAPRGGRSRVAARRESGRRAIARRREADARERLQGHAGRTHPRGRAGAGEGSTGDEVRHSRDHQSHRPVEGRRQSHRPDRGPAQDDRYGAVRV